MTADGVRPEMTEAELLASVLDLAGRLHYLAYHTHNSRHSAKGFPDLCLAHRLTGALLFAELKGTHGRVTPEQDQWLRLLAHRAVVFVWRPEHWHDGSVLRALQRYARAQPPRAGP